MAAPEPTLANLLKEARSRAASSRELLESVSRSAKGMKTPRRKAVDERKVRKISDGQRRWQAFQKFIWEKLKERNKDAPFKAAMSASGPKWDKSGNPIDEAEKAEFEEWLKTNPIPTAENALEARQAKHNAASSAKEVKKDEREAAKAMKAASASAKRTSYYAPVELEAPRHESNSPNIEVESPSHATLLLIEDELKKHTALLERIAGPRAGAGGYEGGGRTRRRKRSSRV
jgi:hypothetical protein